MTIRDILLVVPDEGMLLEPAGIADIFDQANRCLGSAGPTYRLSVSTTLRHRVIHGRSGLNLLADACLGDLDPAQSRDTIISAIADWLRLAAPHARRTVSVCAGAFILAEAGLLDGRRATTHWVRAADLAAQYPAIMVEADKIYVNDGPIWTSAGASAGFDLALALVEQDLGTNVALAVSRQLVMYLRRPGGQSQFSRYLECQARDPGSIRELQAWVLENLGGDLRLEKLADRAAMSPRNFLRVFTRETGTTPARFVETIRLDAARQRLEQGRETVDQVAAACGFGTALTLRRTFERHLGVSPSEYRERFGVI